MTDRSIARVAGYQPIDGVVPGVGGQRALPTPDLGIVDPFVMLDHIGPETMAADWYVDGAAHPHRGFETLTIMMEGVMYHIDSAGNTETLATGSTQNMVAGSGIQHGGDMTSDPDTHVFHEIQLWVNMPAATKIRAPSIHSAHDGEKPVVDAGHFTVEVLTGSLFGATSPLATTQPTSIARIRTSGRGPIVIDGIDPTWNALVYVMRGAIDIAGQAIGQFRTVELAQDGSDIALESTGAGADLLLLTGEPIGEPVAMGGPFVMNTWGEIDQANADYGAGRFGTIEPRRQQVRS
jgi:redox-sensitive bicupin YhaK (pirin superfamily)